MENEKHYWLDNPRNVERIFWSLVGLCVLLTVPDLFYAKHGHFFWEEWPGFYGIYGFISCVGLVLLAKQLRKVLRRDENYYER
ncbi:MAG TPA: hypothetical protein VNL14_02775 [Candidatus Acidoferrales bacterium]|nr:hypothetical protein [Candidatus Acidoferrales bacterium]